MGAGLLNFPKAFNDAGGIEVALAVQILLLFFVIVSLIILAKCADSNGSKTVQVFHIFQNHRIVHILALKNKCKLILTDLNLHFFQGALHGAAGRIGQHTGSFCVALYSFGTCVTFLIIIGDQFDRALASLYGPNFCQYWYMERQFLISACAVIFILPLCFSSRIDFLKYVSSVGVLSIVYVVALIMYEYFQGHHIPAPIKTHPDSWTDVFLVVPAICFGYQVKYYFFQI